MTRSIRVGDTVHIAHFDIRADIEVPAPQPPIAPRLNQAEVDRILASYGRVTATTERRASHSTQQPLDFDPNNLTISERVGLNDMGVYRPRHYKRTGGLT